MRRRSAGRRFLAAGALTAGAALVILWLHGHRRPPPPAADPFPLTPLSASPFRNTGPDAHYVGSDACAPCHPGAVGSHHRTGMGRSMAVVVPEREPPDAVFDHAPSGRRFQVYREDGRLRHRELLRTDDGEEVVLADHAVTHVVGSGRHSLTYVAEAEGFLVESPITWYTSRRQWGMSPGYDKPDHLGFERFVGEGCLMCHAGRAEAVDGSLHRMRLDELTLACEQCHGPGSLHVARWTGREPPAGPDRGRPDDTIVNPDRLSRPLAEAVCEQCHRSSPSMVVARGRKLGDFRPGLPLEDVRLEYRLHAADGSMKVTGHFEQMQQSRCYQASGTLSCLTCHDPHAFPRESDRVDYYRGICLDCHAARACTVDAARRAKESPDDNCVQCHMPTGPTDIPHLAFTHHRIGIHEGPRAVPPPLPEYYTGELIQPVHDPSRFSPVDQKRSLALAYLEVASKQTERFVHDRLRQRGIALLDEVHRAGLPDPVIDCSLARVAFDTHTDEVIAYARRALASPGLPPQDRCDALYVLADAYAAQKRHAEAVDLLHELGRLRRHPPDQLLLGYCELALGHRDRSIAAFEAAVRINTMLPEIHQVLADAYHQQGDEERAAWHRQRAVVPGGAKPNGPG